MSSSSYEIRMQKNFRYLVDKTESHTQLLDSLYNDSVLSKLEHQCIQHIPTDRSRNEQLLLLIMRHSAYEKFLTALKKYKQQHVADVIEAEVEVGDENFGRVDLDDEKKIRLKILRHASQIRDEVDPLYVRPFLFEKAVISRDQYEELIERRGSCRTLLPILERKKHKFASFHFFVALKLQGQRYEYLFDEGCAVADQQKFLSKVKSFVDMETSDSVADDCTQFDGSLSRAELERNLRTCFPYLLENLEPVSTIERLFERNLLSETEIEKIRKFSSTKLKNEHILVTVLKRRSKTTYETFLDALEENPDCSYLSDKVRHQGLCTAANKQHSVTDDDEEIAQKWIKNNERKLLEVLDTADVRPYLFKHGILELVDYEEIICLHKRCQSVIDLLCKHEQQDDMSIQNLNRLPFTRFKEAMTEYYDYLVKKIEATELVTGFLEHPEFLCTLDTGHVGVWGVAVVANVVYIALHNSPIILKYRYGSDEHQFESMQRVEIPKLRWPADLCGDEEKGLLYISDRYAIDNEQRALFVLDGDGWIGHFPMNETPGGLSLTSDGRLLVVCEADKVNRLLRFYYITRDGDSWQMSIQSEIQLEHIERYLLQALLIHESTADQSKTRILISQVHKSTNVHRIVCINGLGDEVCAFGEQDHEHPFKLQFPYSIIPSSDGLLLINDADNYRVIVLRLNDDKLEYQLDLISAEDIEKNRVLFTPRRLFYDAVRGLLFVGTGCKSSKTSDARSTENESNEQATASISRRNVDGNVTVWRIDRC